MNSQPQSASLRRRRAGLFALLRDALAGTESSYTRGPIQRSILLLSIPMMLEMVMESVFAVVDIFWVAHLGAEAIAAVGLSEAVLTLVYAVAIGLSASTTAMVARRVGEGDHDGAAVAAAQALWLGIATAVIVGAAGFAYAADILRLLGAETGVVAGAGYTRVLLGGSGTVLFLFLINAIFRGAGDASVAMRALWLANGINLVLDPLLIFGVGPFPEMGVAGAAVATTIGRGTAVVWQVWMLARGRLRVRVRAAHLRLAPPVMARLVRLSASGVLQFFFATSAWILLAAFVARSGSAALAGYTIAIRVIDFTILPAWGLSNAVATLVGQNLGAGKARRAERVVWLAARYNVGFLLGVSVLFLLGAPFIVAIFTDEAAVSAYAVQCLRYLALGYGFYALGMTLSNALNGAGDTHSPMVMNFVCFWLVQIPLAWVLAFAAGLGAGGVFLAIMMSESLLAVVALWVFTRGAWKRRTV